MIYLADYHGCKVAAKEINESADSDDILEEFRKEAAILSSLRHPCIARFLGIAFCPPDKLILISEYYSKVLNQVIIDESVTIERREKIILELAQGLLL